MNPLNLLFPIAVLLGVSVYLLSLIASRLSIISDWLRSDSLSSDSAALRIESWIARLEKLAADLREP